MKLFAAFVERSTTIVVAIPENGISRILPLPVASNPSSTGTVYGIIQGWHRNGGNNDSHPHAHDGGTICSINL